MRRLLTTMLIAGLALPLTAQVFAPPLDPPPDPAPEAFEPAIERLAAEALTALFAGNRSGFLEAYALYPSHQALLGRYGEGFAFAGRPEAFLQWRAGLAGQHQLAAEFYAMARRAIMASLVGVDEIAVVEVLYTPTDWFGIPAVAGIEVDVQLTHAIRARFSMGAAARMPDGWAFVEAPRPMVSVIKPALRGNDIDLVQLSALDARLPS
jgi:hypothetical protein